MLGLSFKPHSDDVRDSPALDVAVQLHGLGADVLAHDPKSNENAQAKHPQLNYSESIAATIQDAELVVLVTEWPEFVAIDPVWAAGLVRPPP
ncbi:UDP binding domain-containing protein [Cryobacterium inferilacus]|uniref:UDP binding domain-containing protein n=1 Tax=Cryobacterium inferilacus TaxID=2866629 RepID=UPI0027E3569F|nr:UDP binding domain-containing protein [Cryobacterium sp. 1639]